MNKTIREFKINPPRTELSLPIGCCLMQARQAQDGPRFWILCDEDETNTYPVQISCYGNGEALPTDPGYFLGTVQEVRISSLVVAGKSASAQMVATHIFAKEIRPA